PQLVLGQHSSSRFALVEDRTALLLYAAAGDWPLSDAPNSNKFSSHISFRTGVRSSWFNSGLTEVSRSNSCHVGNNVGISIGEVSFADYDFTSIISGSHQPEIVMKLLH